MFILSDSLRSGTRTLLLMCSLGGLLDASGIAVAQEPSPSANPLVGHWRNTKIVFEKPQDTHLFLHAEGIVETWTVTATSRGEKATGRWSSSAKTLTLSFGNEPDASFPFTFYQGQLVLPNIPNKRQFWDKIE